jgi:uridine phosphorylase
MTYPNYKNKHLEEALFGPKEHLKYLKIDKSLYPKNYVFAYRESALRHFKRKYAKKYKMLKLVSQIKIYKIGDVGFVKLNGIGAPHAVTLFEELIVAGGRNFLNIGTAGGLQKQGIFLCNKAIRDEGTSSHYIPHSKYSYPDKKLTEKFRKVLENRKIVFNIAPTWTIDAPYRETKSEIKHYHKEGVATVEMEASALFAVGAVRKAKVAAAFIVSDVLEKKWDQQFHKINIIKGLNLLVDAAIACLSN